MLKDSKNGEKWKTPLIINTLKVFVKDAYPNLFFSNPHYVKYLQVTGSYCNCNFNGLKIDNMKFDINTGVLEVVQNKANAANLVKVKTPIGNQCISGAVVKMSSTGCSKNFQGYTEKNVRKIIDTSSYCVTEGHVCSISDYQCTNALTASSASPGRFDITLNDGPVQFTIEESDNTQFESFYPETDTFSLISQKVLYYNKEDFSRAPTDPRVYIYEVIGPGYSKTWVHSSLKQYIEARPWLLSMVSMRILKPAYYRNTLIHIPGGSCPSSTVDHVDRDAAVSFMLGKMSFTGPGHLIALKENGTYFEAEHSVDDEFNLEEIPFMNQNYFIIIALVVSGLIATYSVLVIIWTLFKILRHFSKEHNQNLAELRRFALTKKFNESENPMDKHRPPPKVLKLNLFSAEPETVHQELSRGNEKGFMDYFKKLADDSDEEEEESSLSFFQTIELYINWWIRSRTNSFYVFLTRIYQTCEGFEDIETTENCEKSTINFETLKELYYQFCMKYGWSPRDIEEETYLLQKFNLKIEQRVGSYTQVYTFIRWKSSFEILSELNPISMGKQKEVEVLKERKDSVITQFLNSECKPSFLKDDYILIDELKDRYEEFCDQRNISQLNRVNIVSSVELEEFGAIYEANFKMTFMKGISQRKIPCGKEEYSKVKSKYIPSLVRVDTLTKSHGLFGFYNWVVNQLLSYKVIGVDGYLTHLVTVMLHVIFLLSFPLFITIMILWSLLQISQIKSGVYSSIFDLGDVFNSSSYDFWLDTVEGKYVLYALLSLGALLFFFGLLELFSFYLTQKRDVGIYPVKKGRVKMLVSRIFWSLVLIFVALYTAYASVILIWCILGAVLNPKKFLPMAIGAIVFVAFSFRLYVKLMDVHHTVIQRVDKDVDVELKESTAETVSKNHHKHEDEISDSSEVTAVKEFHQSISDYMENNNYAVMESNTIDELIDGDVSPLLHIISKNHGVDKNIALGILGIMIENPYTILDSVSKLSEKLKLNPDLNLIITEALLNKHYLKKTAKIYRVIRPVTKKLIQKVFPNFPVTCFDQMHSVLTHSRLEPLIEICENLNIPSHLFAIAIGFANQDRELVNSNVLAFKNYICEETKTKRMKDSLIFNGLEILSNARTTNPYAKIQEILTIRANNLLKYPIAAFKADKILVKNTIKDVAKHIFDVENDTQVIYDFTGYMLALNSLSTSEDLLFDDLIHDEFDPKNQKALRVLFEISKGNLFELQSNLNKLGFKADNFVLIEFCQMLLERETNLTLISQKLSVPTQELEIFNELMHKVVQITKKNLELSESGRFSSLEKDLDSQNEELNTLIETLKFGKSKTSIVKSLCYLSI